MHTYSAHKSGQLAALMAGAFLTFSGATLGKECWVDIYDKANYEGNRQRIEGPADLASLKNLGNRDWSNRIESLQVGSDAEVTAFRKENFENDPNEPLNHPQAIEAWGEKDLPAYLEQEISFGAGKKAHHLGELDFHRNINSLKVRCKK
jgi:hypothetical protein